MKRQLSLIIIFLTLAYNYTLAQNSTNEISIAEKINKQEIYPLIIKSSDFKQPIEENPNWRKIYRLVKRKYESKIAKKQILEAQREWYRVSRPDIKREIEVSLEYYSKYVTNPDRMYISLVINNFVFNKVFYKSFDKRVLKKAAELMRKSIIQYDSLYRIEKPGYKLMSNGMAKSSSLANKIDTRANVLYKSGQVKKAIELQKMIVNEFPEKIEWAETLRKMENGEPTWN